MTDTADAPLIKEAGPDICAMLNADELLALIDGGLADSSRRSLVASTEVTDLLLDLDRKSVV